MHAELSAARARALAISAQLLNRRDTPSDAKTNEHTAGPDAAAVLTALGCIQLDAINVVRRSHELVLLSRGVPSRYAANLLEHTGPARSFEYWAHAVSVLPIELWPLLAFRRRHIAAHGWRGPAVDPHVVEEVRQIVHRRGAVTITELGGTSGSGWDRTLPRKWAAEWLLATGELACVRRARWKRVYEPAAQVIPATLRDQHPDDVECLTALCLIAIRALGIGTTSDIADYFRLPLAAVQETLQRLSARGQANVVRVGGWNEPAWLDPDVMEAATAVSDDSVVPLSPFDSLIWHRPRMRRLFGIDYLLEAYKPAPQRECGYFGLPVLQGDQIIGRIALRVTRRTVDIEGVQAVHPDHRPALHDAITTCTAWSHDTKQGDRAVAHSAPGAGR